ncbi:MAG: putative transposase [Candidatus Binatia bacterium]
MEAYDDNGPCYVSKELAEYIDDNGVRHTRGRPYHPITQGKIERWHRSMKNRVKLENYYSPGELEQAIGRFVSYYNERRYHESLGNITPTDMYDGRQNEIQMRRMKLKRKTMAERRRENLKTAA